jgi:WD40 repeat protein
VLAFFSDDSRFWIADFPSSFSENKPFRLMQVSPERREIVLKKPLLPRRRDQPNAEPVPVPIRNGVALSPEGRYLAVICQITWKEPMKETGLYSFSSSSGDRVVAVWDLHTDAPPVVVESGPIKCLRISADGRYIATGGDFFGVGISDLTTPKHVHYLPPSLSFRVECVLFSRDGRRVISGAQDGRISIGDVETGQQLTWEAHEEAVLALAASPDGRLLASGGADRTLRLWNLGMRQGLARWEAHEEAVTALAFSPDGNILVSGGADGNLKVWDLVRIRRGLSALGLEW